MHSAAAGLLLGLFSAVTLAFANLAVKMGSDILVSRSILSMSAALLLLPVAFLVPAPDAATFHVLAFAIPAHFAYQCCLIQALGRGDLRGGQPVPAGLRRGGSCPCFGCASILRTPGLKNALPACVHFKLVKPVYLTESVNFSLFCFFIFRLI